MPRTRRPVAAVKNSRHPAAPGATDHLAILERAFRELANLDSLDEVKDVRDKAEAIRQYARNAKMGLELQNKAAELKLRAERRAGELLQTISLRGGDRVSDSSGARTTLAQLGISQNQSTRWQKLATVPEGDFCKFLAAVNEGKYELTTAAVLRMATRRSGNREVTAAPTSSGEDESLGRYKPGEIIAEVLNHCHVLDTILSPLYDGEGPANLPAGERRHLRRLLNDCISLLAEIQKHSNPPESRTP
jgi:hypothetical protein